MFCIIIYFIYLYYYIIYYYTLYIYIYICWGPHSLTIFVDGDRVTAAMNGLRSQRAELERCGTNTLLLDAAWVLGGGEMGGGLAEVASVPGRSSLHWAAGAHLMRVWADVMSESSLKRKGGSIQKNSFWPGHENERKTLIRMNFIKYSFLDNLIWGNLIWGNVLWCVWCVSY